MTGGSDVRGKANPNWMRKVFKLFDIYGKDVYIYTPACSYSFLISLSPSPRGQLSGPNNQLGSANHVGIRLISDRERIYD
jgi:hypothetical protein